MEALLYFGKVNLYWILFYACYWLFFRKHTFFQWNRAYLIGSLLISLLLPIISLPEMEQAAPVVSYAISVMKTVPVMATPVESVPETFQWLTWIWLIPCIGSLFMLKRLVRSFWNLNRITVDFSNDKKPALKGMDAHLGNYYDTPEHSTMSTYNFGLRIGYTMNHDWSSKE
jgi:hypothetical protein